MSSGKIFPYCKSLFRYRRNATQEVRVGSVLLGSGHPVRLQSMTTTNTLDAEATAAQCISIFEAGGEIVRITTQGRREAHNLEEIKRILQQKGYHFPIVADIHFNPNAAAIAATVVDKVRINPGNFADGAKKFREKDYTDETYQEEIEEVKKKFLPFLDICKANCTAIRIGANHGSLSDRIMARYGDTPKGMVESCMEYLRICREQNFSDIVLSIKSSNTRVMVHTVRLLVSTMKAEGMNFPLHLGVTEAGSGEDGRIKSAVGIGALLADGLGDTIRVSLTEDPEKEIPVAQMLKMHFETFQNHEPIKEVDDTSYSPYAYIRRSAHETGVFGGSKPPVVIADLRNTQSGISKMVPEAVIIDSEQYILPIGWESVVMIVPCNSEEGFPGRPELIPLFSPEMLLTNKCKGLRFVQMGYPDVNDETTDYLKRNPDVVILLTTNNINGVAEQRAFFLAMNHHAITNPVIVHRHYKLTDESALQIIAGADTGMLFLDGFGDGISIHAPNVSLASVVETQFGILQASRVRFSRTEYISCPGCGRTLFDLQTTTEEVRRKTSHLKGLKIAVMGCIVNGIGEMADADYGYVGAGPGVVSLFKNRELVSRNLPQEEAVDALIDLIKESGDWVDPI
ncbi:(E)-4-hydroxy-3-methylbut-2-enyl-diphosphate synthase [Alkaliflexus imshenetskii]|uniref:(E)-4-hydroxy-3-methylbut-2-enyl-diphosphate synthase n=1 Tax=Alkaliflexus imshenetskii TaxID=286730 RepID=UPI0005C5925A|nr:(E)-4-hydroxy-3-methylbut-2-enyl-diphosphate synthase [Alkaliflexus imshenetskii]